MADLYFTIPQLIAYVTGFTKLSAGDVIVTGTPGGVGLFMEPSGLLSEGDVVEVEITGLGTLKNTVNSSPDLPGSPTALLKERNFDRHGQNHRNRRGCHRGGPHRPGRGEPAGGPGRQRDAR